MEYSLNNNKIFFKHIMLSSKDLSKEIANTEKWKDSGKLEALITINGVEVKAELVQSFFEMVYEGIKKDANLKLEVHKNLLEKRYSDLDKEAGRRVRKILNSKAKKTLKAVLQAERVVKAIINQTN